jgi:hypothetical protein
LTSVCGEEVVPPTVKVAVPEGMPLRGELGVTVAVKVTEEPEMLGLALELTTVVLAPFVEPTVWVNELAAEVEKFASPE